GVGVGVPGVAVGVGVGVDVPGIAVGVGVTGDTVTVGVTVGSPGSSAWRTRLKRRWNGPVVAPCTRFQAPSRKRMVIVNGTPFPPGGGGREGRSSQSRRPA